jgi:hypothetical protein
VPPTSPPLPNRQPDIRNSFLLHSLPVRRGAYPQVQLAAMKAMVEFR